MHAQLKDKNDIKIFVLYLLRNIGYPLDYVTINDVVVQDGFVNSFDFSECFAELLELGNIAEIKEDGEEKYLVTDRGRHVADTLQSKLMNMIREQSLKSALRMLSFRKRGASISFDVRPVEGGRFEMQCAVSDHYEEMLRVKLILDSEAQAEKIRYHFTNNPETAYRGILALLSGEVNYLLS